MEDKEKVVAKTTLNKKTSTTNKTASKTPAKTTVKKTEEVSEKDNVAFDKLQEENKAMQEQMKQMEKMMRELSDKMVEAKSVPTVVKPEYNDVEKEDKELQANEYVKVISLVDELLNLWTEPNHKGRLYGFNKFGQQKDIQYSDVAGILDNQEKFVSQGCLYVLDKRVIERHYLSEIYETFLNKEMIERLLESDIKSDYELFKSTSDKQKEIIIRLYIEKASKLEEDEIDFNKIEFFTKNSGKNVKEMLEEFKSAKSDK